MIMNLMKNENGFALAMILVLSAISLSIMTGLIYMTTTGTQMSGVQKRYRTATDAGLGGIDVTYQLIEERGDALSNILLLTDLFSLSPTINTPVTCTTDVTANNPATLSSCASLGLHSGIAAKILLPTPCWEGCDSGRIIDPAVPSSYDATITIGDDPSYTVYSKIIDTTHGNTGGESGLSKTPVVGSTGGEIAVRPISYLYTVEVDAQRTNNPSERAKFSVLYQY